MKTSLAAAAIALAPTLAFAGDMHAFDYTGNGTPVPLAASQAGPMARAQAAPAAVKAPSVAFLTRNSDYRVFMKAGVPAETQRQALRVLWSTHPEFSQASADVTGYPTEPAYTTLAALR